jgi:hypothetical protein
MSVGVMTVGVMSVGEITVGVMTVGVMTVGVMRRPQKSKRRYKLNNTIRNRSKKYDHECRKTHQIKRVCGTCYAYEFNLNAFRHE